MTDALRDRQEAWASLGQLVQDVERCLNEAALASHGHIPLDEYQSRLARVRAYVEERATTLTIASFQRYVAEKPRGDTTFYEKPRISGKWAGDRTRAARAKARRVGQMLEHEPVRLVPGCVDINRDRGGPVFFLLTKRGSGS